MAALTYETPRAFYPPGSGAYESCSQAQEEYEGLYLSPDAINSSSLSPPAISQTCDQSSGGTTACIVDENAVRLETESKKTNWNKLRCVFITCVVSAIILVCTITVFSLIARNGENSRKGFQNLESVLSDLGKDLQILAKKINSSAEVERKQELSTTILNSGWYRLTNKHFYKQYPSFKTYYDAKFTCESVGARLASTGIRDPIFRREVISLIRGCRTWIGLDDLAQEGTWIWSDGAVFKETGLWKNQEPKNFTAGEDCAEMIESGLLNVQECSEKFRFICEI